MLTKVSINRTSTYYYKSREQNHNQNSKPRLWTRERAQQPVDEPKYCTWVL